LKGPYSIQQHALQEQGTFDPIYRSLCCEPFLIIATFFLIVSIGKTAFNKRFMAAFLFFSSVAGGSSVRSFRPWTTSSLSVVRR